MRYEHTVDIAAPRQLVWDLTEAVEGWPAITPTMRSVERLDHGPLQPGSTARVRQPGQRTRTWTVTEVAPPSTFTWAAPALGSTMVGSHEIEAVGEGACRLRLVLVVEGRTAGLVGRLLGGQLRKAIATEAEGFKATAEARVTGGSPTGA